MFVASFSQADPNRSFTFVGAHGILAVCGQLKEGASWRASPIEMRGSHGEVLIPYPSPKRCWQPMTPLLC
jgi:hypothetical protein